MRLLPSSFNGFLFQQQNTRVTSDFEVPYDWNIGGISSQNTARNQNRPKYSGKIYGGSVKVVNINLNKLNEDKDSLVIAMDLEGDQQHPLYATDELGKSWYVNAVCVGLNNESIDGNTASFGYIFEVDDPTWKSVDEVSDTWAIVASGDEHTITIDGDQNSIPTFELTPTSNLANYYPNKDYIKNYNPIAVAQIDGIDITNGGWNHAAAVIAGEALANGNDVRVIVDGAEVPRWFGGGGLNSATLKIWIRLQWLPGRFLTLLTAVANSGTPAQLQFSVTDANKTALTNMPVSGIIRLDNEEFSYRNKNVALCTLDVVQRTIRGTSIAAHSTGATAWWVEHDIKLVYGDALATAPVYSDVYKPVFDLTSTNTSRIYTSFADTANLRAGAWKRQVINDGKGKLNRVYSGNQASDVEVDPATDMGMEIAAYQSQGKWKPETAELAWQLYHPAGITVVTSSGEKYKLLSTSIWPTKAELASSVNGITWVREWNESAPGSAATWTAWTHNNEAIAAGRPYVRFHFQGSVNAVANNVVDFEVDSVTITINSSNVIQIAMNGKIAGLKFSSELENETTGQKIFIEYPVSQNQTLIINTEDYVSTYRGMNALRGISLDGIRTEWLVLVPGENILKYTAYTFTGAITLVTKYHLRSL